MNKTLTRKISVFTILKTQLFTLILLTTTSIVFSQGIDLNYDPAVGRITVPNTLQFKGDVSIQPDGKILVFGAKQLFASHILNNLAGDSNKGVSRLNTDGTLDTTFNCDCTGFTRVFNAKAQNDGKIVITGLLYANSKPGAIRVNADGSLDGSFTSSFANSNYFEVRIEGFQSDGKVIYSFYYSIGGSQFSGLRRLNANGTEDSSFVSFIFRLNQKLNRLEILPNDKIMVAGQKDNNQDLFRLNADGSIDSTFEIPVLISGNGGRLINDFAFQSDGKIVISGIFAAINGLARTNFARLNANGTVDAGFSQFYMENALVEVLSNDKIIVSNASNTSAVMQRLNADGTADIGFNSILGTQNFVVDSSDRILIVQSQNTDATLYQEVRRFDSDGNVDNSFQRAILGVVGDVETLELQSDGKALVSGVFSSVDGVFKAGLARINTDGTVDTTFDSPEVDDVIREITVQSDGKILIGGLFDNVGGTTQFGVARLNSDGSQDTSFNPVLTPQNSNSGVVAIAVQSNGQILIGGSFDQVNGTTQNAIARLNSDGSFDASFNPILTNAFISAIAIQSDGKIMIGGGFNGISGSNRTNVARLNSDGTLDLSFNAGSGVQALRQIVIKPNGQYFINDGFRITLRNSDGTIDNSFTPPTLNGRAKISLQTNGTLIIVGEFNQVNGVFRRNIARILTDGSLDTTFYPRGADGNVKDIVVQSDGKVIIGGQFIAFNNVARSGLARFTVPPVLNISPTTNFDFDGDGKADVAVFRPSENKWYVLRSSDFGVTQQVWGINGDYPVPFDFDADGKLDYSIFRESSGDWWTLSGASGSQINVQNGSTGDIPRPSDFDGDGRTDYIVFRPSNNTWYRRSSTGAFSTVVFGLAGDKPLVGDFDGDGKSDVAIYRPSTGDWWWQSSVDNIQRATHWGISTDIPTPGDYDGDGITDFAVYRPAEGFWYILNSSSGNTAATIIQFGIAEDKPVPADYDGDGKADIAVYRPSTGVWYLLRSTEGFQALQFGISSDIPIPNALIP